MEQDKPSMDIKASNVQPSPILRPMDTPSLNTNVVSEAIVPNQGLSPSKKNQVPILFTSKPPLPQSVMTPRGATGQPMPGPPSSRVASTLTSPRDPLISSPRYTAASISSSSVSMEPSISKLSVDQYESTSSLPSSTLPNHLSSPYPNKALIPISTKLVSPTLSPRNQVIAPSIRRDQPFSPHLVVSNDNKVFLSSPTSQIYGSETRVSNVIEPPTNRNSLKTPKPSILSPKGGIQSLLAAAPESNKSKIANARAFLMASPKTTSKTKYNGLEQIAKEFEKGLTLQVMQTKKSLTTALDRLEKRLQTAETNLKARYLQVITNCEQEMSFAEGKSSLLSTYKSI